MSKRLSLFNFTHTLMGYHYIRESKLNREMADFGEAVGIGWLETRHKTRRRIKACTLIPRKGRKSTIITQSAPPYLLTRDPNLSIVIDSEMKQRSNDFLGATSRVLSGEAKTDFIKYYGNWKHPDKEWRSDRITIAPRTYMQRKEPSIVTASVEIGYTGGAPDVIAIDDPMSPESHTDSWMNKVVKHYVGLGPILQPNGLFLLCMTRYDDGDLYGHIEETEGIHMCEAREAADCVRSERCMKATPEHPEPWHVMFRQAWDDDEKSIDEVVWPTEFLHAENKKSPGFFAAQYLNNPWHNPDASFQPEDFTYTDTVPGDVVTILSSDTAWKDTKDSQMERGGDWNVFVEARHQAATGRVYVTGVYRGRWTEGEWGDELVRIMRKNREKRYPVSRFIYEEMRSLKGAIASVVRSACQRWREHAPALVIAPRSNQLDAKTARIKATAIYYQNHNIIFVRPCKDMTYAHGCEKCNTFQILRSELLKLGATKYNDCADAISDHFIPEIYHAPSVELKSPEPPRPRRPYDLDLKPGFAEMPEWKIEMDENDVPKWVPTDAFYPREPI